MVRPKKNLFVLLSSLVISLCLTNTSYADAVIYDNGEPISFMGGSNLGDRVYAADDFTITFSQTISGVRFWAGRGSNESPNLFGGEIYWAIHNDNTGSPGDVLFSGLSPTTETFFRAATGGPYNITYTEFRYDFSTPPLSLEAGTYWLELHHGAPSSVLPNLFWTWSPQNASYDLVQRIDPTGDWFNIGPGDQLAFQLTTPVPEPTTLLLLSSGLAGVSAIIKRRRSSGMSGER